MFLLLFEIRSKKDDRKSVVFRFFNWSQRGHGYTFRPSKSFVDTGGVHAPVNVNSMIRQFLSKLPVSRIISRETIFLRFHGLEVFTWSYIYIYI